MTDIQSGETFVQCAIWYSEFIFRDICPFITVVILRIILLLVFLMLFHVLGILSR